MWLKCSMCSKNCFFTLLSAIFCELPITRTPDDSNSRWIELFSISLEGSSYRESTVISWGAVFIIQTSDRMQYFTILQDKLNSFNIQDDRSKRGLLARPFKKCPKSPLQLAGSRTGQICSASRCAWMNINRVTLRIYYRIIEFIMFIFYVMVHNEVWS